MAEPYQITRNQLIEFLGNDERAIRAFELLFKNVTGLEDTYLPLIGGTLVGQLVIEFGTDGFPGLVLNATESGGDALSFNNFTDNEVLFIGTDSNEDPVLQMTTAAGVQMVSITSTNFVVDLELSVSEGGTFNASETDNDFIVKKDGGGNAYAHDAGLNQHQFSGGLTLSSVTKTANYTVTSSDLSVIIDASSNAVTISTPSAPQTGQALTISCLDSTFAAVIDFNGKNFYDSPDSEQIFDYENVSLQYDGAKWVSA